MTKRVTSEELAAIEAEVRTSSSSKSSMPETDDADGGSLTQRTSNAIHFLHEVLA